jgi:hypothetical protein
MKCANRVFLLLAGLAPIAIQPAFAGPHPKVQPIETVTEYLEPSVLAGGGASSHADTAWFGGSGTGNGTVVRGGLWNFESDSGEPPEFFPDGDPVGNQYRDGWTFEDRSTRSGPSQTGAPHWNSAGVYDFNYDATPQGGPRPGGYAHRATTHANNGINDGPDPLAGGWSIWVGTNLELNPENCAWSRTSGYGDGWSQGITKSFAIPAGSSGAQYDLAFMHRYAVEPGFDSCFVEISLDGVAWNKVGTYNGGDRNNPLPGPAGGNQLVNLIRWQTNAAGTLHVRFHVSADGFLSDSGDGGNFGFCWQLDNVNLLRNSTGVPGELTNFESSYNGWQPATFEGKDFEITHSLILPAGRIVPISALACPPIAECPETCGLENNIVMFADKDDCDLPDGFMDSFIRSPVFAIGGPSLPDLDGDAGRLILFDIYTDGGSGTFETGNSFCYEYWPFSGPRCPFTPAGGHPGAGTTFAWSQTSTQTCDFFSQGTGTDCINNGIDDISANIPSTADSVILHVGAFSQCRAEPTCDPHDNGAPFYDNLRFGVFNPQGVTVSSATLERYADNFPTANGNIVIQTARMDGAHSFPSQLGGGRSVRADTAAATCGRANTAMYLRFRVTPGLCQPNLTHPFFISFPPNQWHAARMDTGHSQGQGTLVPGTYMTCFHKDDPHNGTFWTGVPPAFEPCDDILPDGLFTPGTRVQYFFEARDVGTGAVVGTFPMRRDRGPIGTTENFATLWLDTGVLPELDPACNGAYAHNLLVIDDYQTSGVPGRGTTERERLLSTLQYLGLDFDVYDCVGTNFTSMNEGIGRREDRPNQLPRPPMNGATQLQLEPYDCIWYTSGLSKTNTLSDQMTPTQFNNDQQKLETWLAGCTAGVNRLLVLEGAGWASDIATNTMHGPAFLADRGVSVLASDYAQQLANNDLRRCARINGSGLAPEIQGEVFGTGCPDDIAVDVLQATGSGEGVLYFVESLEDGDDPVNCADDVPHNTWHAVVRRAAGAGNCQRSVSMSFTLSEFLPLHCNEQCLFDDYRIDGPNADLVFDLFLWAGRPLKPIGVGDGAGGAPAIVATLGAPRPNPAHSSPLIRYSIAQRGRVRLKIYDVGGRLVRTLVDQVQEPLASGYEVVWDGNTDAGARAGSGVYFYELHSPGFAATKKLVLLE